jgi:hypothetical protein
MVLCLVFPGNRDAILERLSSCDIKTCLIGEWGLQESLNLGKEKRNYSAAPSRFCLVALEMNTKPAFDHSPNPSPNLSLDWEPDFQLWRKGKEEND